MDRAHQIRSIELRFIHTVIRARLNNFSNSFLVGMLGQQDEGYGAPRPQKLGEQLGGCGIPGLMFEQDQPVVSPLQHRLRFFHRTRVIEFRKQSALVPGKDLTDQEKVLLLASHQQDSQNRQPELCRG